MYNVRDMNLEQVARRAKVSTATVSRVLNNASVVKTSTRARVVKAIEELKYHPNLHARNLAGGKSRTIGMIVSNMENPFFFDIYKTVESDAHAAGFEVVVANTDYRSEQLVASIRLMIGRRVAGLGGGGVGDGTRADRGTHRQQHSGGVLRCRRAAARTSPTSA